jgi:hypothetical protein
MNQLLLVPSMTYTVAPGWIQKRLVDLFLSAYVAQWLDQVALRLPRVLGSTSRAREVSDHAHATNRTDDGLQRFEKEVGIWRRLNHPNVLPLYGVVNIGASIYSVCSMNGVVLSKTLILV